MTQHLNHYQQPVGFPLPEWQPRALPQRVTLSGRTCRLEPFSVEAHGRDGLAALAHSARASMAGFGLF